MYQRLIPKINQDIERTGKAIISIGCSFVQGQGAVNDEMYSDYDWKFEKLGVPLHLNYLSKEEKEKIVQRYPSVSIGPDGNLDFTFMEYDNAFVNVLAEKYFEGGYAAINLGRRGCGNRASIKDLYFYPEINWDKIKEVIVLYCPSGPERFDFANDAGYDHHYWKAMWPNFRDMEESRRKMLWQGYAEHIHSEKFEVLEQVANVQELLTWCKLKKAKLIITPGFDGRYTTDHFLKSLSRVYERNMDGEILNIRDNPMHESMKFLKMFPWEHKFKPRGHDTFVDLVMAQEHPTDLEYNHFFQYLGKASANGWITSCAHPSAKGHDLFAQVLFEHIQTGLPDVS